MGLIICDKHGQSGFIPHVSKELSDKILNGVFLDASELAYVDIVFIDEDDGQEMFEVRYWMSKNCFESISAKHSYQVISDQDERELDAIFNPVMKGGGVCVKCFDEYLIRAKSGSTILQNQ